MRYVGIDWSTSSGHQVCLLAEANSNQVQAQRTFEHSAEGLAGLGHWLIEKTAAPAGEICVAIERPDGAVVETLLELGFRVFSINPKQADRFRDRFSPAGAKDDRRDALVLASALRTDLACFREITVDDPTIVELRGYSRLAEELKSEQLRQGNRIREQLLRYYPQALELTSEIHATWFLELWALAPTPKKAKRLRRSSVERVLRANRIRRWEPDQVRTILRQPALSVAAGTTEAAVVHIRSLAERLLVVNRQYKECLKQIDALVAKLAAATATSEDREPGQDDEQSDVAILNSLPGIGRINLATLLASAHKPLSERNYHTLRLMTGVAPVTRQSGRRRSVLMRRACNKSLRNALFHWARVAAQRDPTFKARYAALRAKGKSHPHALRVVGDRLLYVACAMLRNRTLYRPHQPPRPELIAIDKR